MKPDSRRGSGPHPPSLPPRMASPGLGVPGPRRPGAPTSARRWGVRGTGVFPLSDSSTLQRRAARLGYRAGVGVTGSVRSGRTLLAVLSNVAGAR